MNDDEILAEAKRRADAYITSKAVVGRMRAFECGSALDPLFRWSFATVPNREEFLVTQDWYLEEENGKSSGTVEENVEYTQHCWDVRYWKKDATFNKMFHGKESRPRLKAGKTLVLNAAWGLRSRDYFKSAESTLPYDIHVAALDLWLWLATELKPKRIFMAGGWARENTNCEAFDVLTADEYLRSAQWPRCPVVDKALTVLSGTFFHLIHHPVARLPFKFIMTTTASSFECEWRIERLNGTTTTHYTKEKQIPVPLWAVTETGAAKTIADIPCIITGPIVSGLIPPPVVYAAKEQPA
jgi:hypothetical protein